MNNKITLRSYKSDDEKEVKKIIREAWHYDDFCSAKTADKMAAVFLYSCLANQTFTLTAEIDGAPAGIIMAKNIKKHRCPLKYRIKQILSIISLYMSGEGRRTSKIFKNVSGTDKELLNNCNTSYQGEVAFFAISSKYRGHGLGKLLFDKMLSYMKQENINDFYLFTDTSCNFGFYEHQGMKRRQEKKAYITAGDQTREMDFFIYDYQF